MNLKSLFGFGKKDDKSELDSGIECSIKLKELSRIPLVNRDLEWDRAFIKNAAQAHLACKVPQIQNEQNGFPYFQLEIPDVGKPFEAYTIEKLIETDLLRDGKGACIYSYDNKPDLLLSYGELLNYHYRGTFRSNIKNWLAPSPNQFQSDKEIMGGNPSEKILTSEAREVIKSYLKKNGIEEPKISLLNIMTENGIMYQLVFNLNVAQFDDEKHFQACLSSLAWFLPIHYTYTAIPEHYMRAVFHDL